MSSLVHPLAVARKQLGWAPARLAAEAGIDRDVVYDIEASRNQRPSHFNVTRLVAALRRGGLDVVAEILFPVPLPVHVANSTRRSGRVQGESARERSAK